MSAKAELAGKSFNLHATDRALSEPAFACEFGHTNPDLYSYRCNLANSSALPCTRSHAKKTFRHVSRFCTFTIFGFRGL